MSSQPAGAQIKLEVALDYGFNLTKEEIEDIYGKYRNLLVHNSALAPGAGLANSRLVQG